MCNLKLCTMGSAYSHKLQSPKNLQTEQTNNKQNSTVPKKHTDSPERD